MKVQLTVASYGVVAKDVDFIHVAKTHSILTPVGQISAKQLDKSLFSTLLYLWTLSQVSPWLAFLGIRNAIPVRCMNLDVVVV